MHQHNYDVQPTGYGFLVTWGQAGRRFGLLGLTDAGDVSAVVTVNCIDARPCCYHCARRGLDFCEHVRAVIDHMDARP